MKEKLEEILKDLRAGIAGAYARLCAWFNHAETTPPDVLKSVSSAHADVTDDEHVALVIALDDHVANLRAAPEPTSVDIPVESAPAPAAVTEPSAETPPTA